MNINFNLGRTPVVKMSQQQSVSKNESKNGERADVEPLKPFIQDSTSEKSLFEA